MKKNSSLLTSLSKYVAQAGVASRRHVVELIKQGLIRVNGAVVTQPSYQLKSNDLVTYRKKKIVVESKKYILLNKPKDYITTASDEQGRKTVLDLMPSVEARIYPVGRLDRDTTGLLLLTNDGDLAQRLSHPRYEVKKIYAATLDRILLSSDFEQIANGVTLTDGFIKPDMLIYASSQSKNVVHITVHSGKNRIIRRIFEKIGYEVAKLDRIEYAGLTKKELPIGQWRSLTPLEIKKLLKK